MSACMAVWAIISLLTAFSRNYIGLLMTRFTLGITEAPYYPGALYILATFYTRKELATRISILYTGNILATAFAGLIALGIFKMHGMAGLAGWQWLFILQGAVGSQPPKHAYSTSNPTLDVQVTLVVAIGAVFILPDEPLTTRWLTEEERLLAHERTQRDTVANAGQTTTWSGIYEAAKDPKVWLFVFMQHCHLGELPASHTSETPQLPLHFTYSFERQRRKWVQELLPDCREDARVRSDYHACPDLPAIPHRGHHLHRLVVVIRTLQRAHMVSVLT